MVEFALILPLVMSIVLGLVTGGAAYNRKLSMTNAVREGARFGATLNGTGSWATDVQSRTVAMAAGDLTTDQVCVKLVKVGTGDLLWATGSECSSITPFTTHPGSTGDCVVEVWAARPDKIQAMFFTSNITLTAKAGSSYEAAATSC